MIKRTLSSEEKIILDTIIAQRVDSEGDIFEYDYKIAREYMRKSGISRKLMITPKIQREIIVKLSSEHIIDSDVIINTGFIDNLRISQNSNYVPDKSMPKFYWLNGTTWAYEDLQLGGKISAEKIYELNDGGLFIRMTEGEAKKITENYIANKIVYLKIDADECCLCLKIGKDQNWVNISTLHDGSLPYKVLFYAWQNANKKVTLQEMLKAGIISSTDAKRYMTSIFQRNTPVKVLSPKMLELGTNSIIFRDKANYTTDEINALKDRLRI